MNYDYTDYVATISNEAEPHDWESDLLRSRSHRRKMAIKSIGRAVFESQISYAARLLDRATFGMPGVCRSLLCVLSEDGRTRQPAGYSALKYQETSISASSAGQLCRWDTRLQNVLKCHGRNFCPTFPQVIEIKVRVYSRRERQRILSL